MTSSKFFDFCQLGMCLGYMRIIRWILREYMRMEGMLLLIYRSCGVLWYSIASMFICLRAGCANQSAIWTIFNNLGLIIPICR
jgi:hypothetical protein